MKYNNEHLIINNLIKNKKGGNALLGMLQNLYCSCQSEVSAFLLFNYQSIILKNKNNKLSSILESFSKQSLANSKILAELIIKQKGLPFYFNSQHSPFNAFWLKYDTDQKTIIENNINLFTSIIQNYSIYISKIKKNNILKVLNSLKKSNEQMLMQFNDFTFNNKTNTI